MKDLGKKLTLNKTTIDILDNNALENVKGGAAARGRLSCGFLSIACGSCNTETTSEPTDADEAANG